MDKQKTLDPFQCLLTNGGESVIVNFGTVICTASDTVISTFVPTLEGLPLKRFREEGFSERNSLAITSSNSIVCLKVILENIENLVESVNLNWEDITLAGTESTLKETFDRCMSLELQRQVFNLEEDQSVQDIDYSDDTFLDSAVNTKLNPIIPWSPTVLSVEIVERVFQDLSEEELSSELLLIQQNGETYYKLVPIAIIQDSVLEQIINFDLVFSCPLYWLETLKYPFTNVSA
jgi:hypothetical protein